jgi:hypothetical protein
MERPPDSRNKPPGPAFPMQGPYPPFKTAPVADSQRSLTRCSKRARARIAKGGGPIFSLRRSPAHYEGMGT